MAEQGEVRGINTYHESTLHAQLKSWYSQPGDRLEVPVNRYVVDIVRGSQLIEIQTQNFSALRPKLENLLEKRLVRIVYPIAQTKWIAKIGRNKETLERRKSPLKGQLSHVASELVYIHQFISSPNFALEILMIEVEEVRQCLEGRRWRRRKWQIKDRRLIKVSNSVMFSDMSSYLQLLPDDLPAEFTTGDLTKILHQRRRITQQLAYSLHKLGIIQRIGKRGNAFVYRISSPQ